MSIKKDINGIQQFAVVNIPWTINWEALEIKEEEDKQKFIQKFIENIRHKPIISYDPENPSLETESTIGIVEAVYNESLDTINLFCSMWLVVSPEYEMISTIDNMNEPLGLRLIPNSICIQFDKKLNKAYMDAANVHEGVAARLREALDPSFAQMIEEYNKKHPDKAIGDKNE